MESKHGLIKSSLAPSQCVGVYPHGQKGVRICPLSGHIQKSLNSDQLLARFAKIFNLVGEAPVTLISSTELSFLCLFLFCVPLWNKARIDQQIKENLKKNEMPFMLPCAQFFIDVSQLHSKFIIETSAEIMIKTLASCNFEVIGDISAALLSYQSSTQIDDLSLFKQLTSLAASSGSVLSRSTSTCVFHYLPEV